MPASPRAGWLRHSVSDQREGRAAQRAVAWIKSEIDNLLCLDQAPGVAACAIPISGGT